MGLSPKILLNSMKEHSFDSYSAVSGADPKFCTSGPRKKLGKVQSRMSQIDTDIHIS